MVDYGTRECVMSFPYVISCGGITSINVIILCVLIYIINNVESGLIVGSICVVRENAYWRRGWQFMVNYTHSVAMCWTGQPSLRGHFILQQTKLVSCFHIVGIIPLYDQKYCCAQETSRYSVH